MSSCLGSPSSGEQGLCGPAGATPLQAVIVSSPSQPWLPFLPEKMQGCLAQMGHRGVLLCSSSCPLKQAPEHSQEGQLSSGSPAAAWGHLAASPESCQAPGARGSGQKVPINRAATQRVDGTPRAAEQHAWDDLTQTGQFSRKIKTAKTHPRSGRNKNRSQTGEETAKVVKGLTARMVKARRVSFEVGGTDRSRTGSCSNAQAATESSRRRSQGRGGGVSANNPELTPV